MSDAERPEAGQSDLTVVETPDADRIPLVDQPETRPVVSSDVVFEGRVWNIRRDVVGYGDSEITRDYVDHTGAVAILALDENNRVLLIQQYRHPIAARDWELPAGLLDAPGESKLDAAKRELAEEVDLAAADWHELVAFNTSPGGSNEVVTVYLARGLTATPTFDRSEEEADIVLRWAPLDEVVGAILDGSLRNSILMIAVLAAHARP
jgi:8-oxo-dGTP pyrophosphatase MutT (NUDIX family)